MRGFNKEWIFDKKFMVPILIFESLFFVIEILYFLFADLRQVETAAFYILENICLVLFMSMAILLLIFFLRKDKFLICEITFSGVLILVNLIIIAMRIAIWDEDHIFLVICLWFGWALRVVVIYFRLDQYWFKINWLIFNRKISHMKRTWTPV